SAVTRLRRGLEAPARLFTLLAEELGLTQAALLLYDPLRLVYAPWAACGFDPTTLQRLRIPLACSPSLNPLAAGETLFFSEEADLAQLRAFFSFREFSALRQVLLVPFVHAGKWIGILLVTRRSDRAPGDPQFYGDISERGAELLYEARERHLETLAQDERHLDAVRQELLARPGALPELVTRAAQTALEAQRAVLAVRLDMRGVAAALLRATPALDPFRLQEDVGAVVLALASSVGTAVRLGADHLLVLIHGMGTPDPELFLRHLESVLRHYFPTLGELEGLGLNPEVRSWNGPPEHAGQILDSFQ
ncbi:MAG: hypothetical protein JW820_13060, partial [Spirochaetales bacterium]|nr:hypothetical protein [Spirochaetales bacterium]